MIPLPNNRKRNLCTVDERIARVIQHFAVTEAICVSTVAAELTGLSASRASRLFHAVTGITLRQYVRALSLDRASTLLSTTSVAIQEIACAIGYRHCSHFARAFRKAYGTSPSKWRTATSQVNSNPAPSLEKLRLRRGQ
jgi:AraC-like DNA-binding protein